VPLFGKPKVDLASYLFDGLGVRFAVNLKQLVVTRFREAFAFIYHY
jgi:hypothetical protein